MKLNEGGNSTTKNGDKAAKVEIAQFDEPTYNAYKNAIIKLVKDVDVKFKKATGKSLFSSSDAVDSFKVFSGSGKSFFVRSYEEFTKIKPRLGDIDVQVDVANRAEIIQFMDDNIGKTFGGFKYLGHSGTSDIYNVFAAPKQFQPQATNIQIDFEFVEFDEEGNPNEFDMYTKNSEWEDMSQGIKGLAKQVLISTLYKVVFARQAVLFQNKKDLPAKNQKDGNFPTKSFGFKGTRTKYQPVLDAEGNPVLHDGKPAVRELPVAATKTEKSVDRAFYDLFKKEPSVKEKQMFYSYIGVLSLMKKYLDKATIQKVFDAYLKDIEDNTAQEPEVMEPIVNKFKSEFPFVVDKNEATAWQLYINKQMIEG